MLSVQGRIKKDFDALRENIKRQSVETKDTAHLDNISVVCLGDYYSSIAVFDLNEVISENEAISLGTEILKNIEEYKSSDTADYAWDFVKGWIISNKNRFCPTVRPATVNWKTGNALYYPQYFTEWPWRKTDLITKKPREVSKNADL